MPTIFYFAILAFFLYMIGTFCAIIAMKPDYFIPRRESKPLKEEHFIIWLVSKTFKNALGLILIIGGFIMLFTPGQGLLTILLGVFFMDLPGKKKLERYLIRKPALHKSLNWIRKKANKKPIQIPKSDK